MTPDNEKSPRRAPESEQARFIGGLAVCQAETELTDVVKQSGSKKIRPERKMPLAGVRAMSKAALDRTAYHRFGASYDPKRQAVAWWLETEGNLEVHGAL